ncbi:hypothetical protein J6590_011743 [Homalodisca vitripennis]|nr:hypothetical protein J6590_011743 [Homalodisca vitripennis]
MCSNRYSQPKPITALQWNRQSRALLYLFHWLSASVTGPRLFVAVFTLHYVSKSRDASANPREMGQANG